MVYCCVPFCKSQKGKRDYIGISFHEIPSHNVLRDQWLRVISREGDKKGSKWTPSDRSVVCSKHFTNQDFKENCKLRKLKATSVPSVFPDYPTYKQQPTSRKRKSRDSSTTQSTSRKRRRDSSTARFPDTTEETYSVAENSELLLVLAVLLWHQFFLSTIKLRFCHNCIKYQ